MKGKCCFSHPPDGEEVDDDEDSTEKDLEQFGYAPTMNSELQTALQTLPSRQCLDALVDHFVNDVNYRHYIIHPVKFRQEYNQWWADRDNGKPLGLQWTSLLLMVCACSAQHPSDAVRQVLRADKAPPALELSNSLHSAACELHRAVSADALNLYTVQQLLHSFFWLKSRSCYVDCWGTLKNAFVVFRGLSKLTFVAGIEKQDGFAAANCNEDPNYLKEMGKRAWVVMTTWNCGQNYKAYDEEGSEKEDYEPSRMPDHLPDNMSWRNTSTEFDANIWAALQDFILSTMRLSSTLDPLRPHLIRQMSQASSVTELRSRQQALRLALKYINCLFKFLRFIFPEDAIYHVIIFLIFDVATLLGSAVLHDSDSSMPTRVTSWEAVQSTLCMLKKLSSKVPIAKKAFEVLGPIYNEMLKQSTNDEDVHQRKRPRLMMNPDSTESGRDSVLLGQSDPRRPKVYNFTLDFPKKDQKGRFRVYAFYPFSNNMRFYMDPFATQTIPPKWESDDITSTRLHLTQRTLEALLPSLPSPKDIEASEEANHVPEVKHSLEDTPLGIMEGLWDYGRVNLEYLSPQLDH
ncbi:hypothetical protein ACHAPE_000172 [Trichoderma viride]